jgi:BirA family transcriptional regulator, biotin operon repressor / biotin---[acetyl-CoA-carboxylase] ligase
VSGQPFISRQQRFAVVGSTNDVVRRWLADGVPEVCLAQADQQTAGRGRESRTWIAPAGRALLLSAGFRPTYLAPDEAWRLAAIVSLAMAGAAEEVTGLADGSIQLKWPNDLVIDVDREPRKLAGVLGETFGLGTDDPRAVVGIGVNANWHAADFPPELSGTMTSLREAAGDRERPLDGLLTAFVAHLAAGFEALRAGRFDSPAWVARQATTNTPVLLELPDGEWQPVHALGVDPESGALVVDDPGRGGRRFIHSGEIRHLRLSAAARPGRQIAPVEV